ELPALLDEVCGKRAGEVTELFDRFADGHPHHAPHYYLSLLGTHPDHRGRGVGMALLRGNLADYDAEGVATYLESSNPATTPRYGGLGFRQMGSFPTPDTSHRVARMWRDVGGET